MNSLVPDLLIDGSNGSLKAITKMSTLILSTNWTNCWLNTTLRDKTQFSEVMS
ncbi:unnamed protein product [Oppiella nova]|uniref:Uncharacterized protein n=1 Tax=Oppiella nova TaxID=334625 RepID=A0A7R9R397_9ACAR|nr:unnamed protein product [Oppiella nova]CAG2184120.1 unnamed protein product [Oppiella nova]